MKVKVLATPEDKIRGVIGQPNINIDEVYVFLNIYENDGFHMRGVPFPIDIAFLDKQFEILDVQQMEPEVGKIKAPIRSYYAVEACKDYFKTQNLKRGDFWKSLYAKMS